MQNSYNQLMLDENPIIQVRRLNQVLVVSVRKEAGLNEDLCIEAREAIEQILTTTAYKHLVLDMKEMVELNSNFLGSLTALNKLSKKHAGSINLAGLHDSTAIIFKVSGLTKVFEIFETVEEAAVAIGERIN